MKIKVVTGLLVVGAVILTAFAVSAQTTSALYLAGNTSRPQQVGSYGKLPLSFEPNKGQTDARVTFVSRGAGYAIFLTPMSATFALQGKAESAVVRMDLVGADSKAAMQPEEKLPGITSYLIGRAATKLPTNLPTYAKTRTRNVYPGIDLVYYGAQGQLEYDFVLAPRADPSKIRLKFEGASPRVDASGDLVVRLGAGEGQNDIRFRKPVLYQQVMGVREPVGGTFTVSHNNEVGFHVNSYDRSRELVIDPVLMYSSYLGGSNVSQINAMALNAAGDIYVAGSTEAINYPTTAGVIQTTCPLGNTQLGAPAGVPKCGEGESGTPAVFVSKISANGQTLLYSTYLGGGGNGAASDYGTGIAVDANDDAWVVGLTISNDFPITADAYLAFCNPAAQGFNFSTLQNYGEISACIGNNTRSAFLVHLNPTGTAMLYGTFLSGTGDVGAAQIALDAAGDIYVAGTTYTNGAGTPAYVFSNNGQFNYPTTASAYQPIVLAGAHYSAFVTKLTPDGKSLLYSTMLGGPNQQDTVGNALAIGEGKIFVGGYTRDTQLPTTASAISRTCVGGPTAAGADTVCTNGSHNAWVAEFDPAKSGAASLVFSTYLNGSVSTQGNEFSIVNALAADTAGNVYVGGQDTYTVKEGFPTTPGVLQPTCLAASNSGECGTGFVTKLSPAGALLWSTFYASPSGAGQYGVSVIALDAGSNVYIANNADGAGDLPLKNGFQNYTSGVAYVTELSSDGSQVLFGSFFGGGANINPTAMVVDGAGSIYLGGFTNADLPLVNALQSNNYGGGFSEGFFAKIGKPVVAAASFVSAASGANGTIAAGSIESVYGSDLAIAAASETGLPLPVTLMGTSIKIVDSTSVSIQAPLFFVSPGQANFLVPSGVAHGSASITITSGDGTLSGATVSIGAVSPGLFVLNAAGLVAADLLTVNTGGAQVNGTDYQVVNGVVVPLAVNLGPPAQQVFLILYGTGISGRSSLANVSVSIGGLSLPVAYAGTTTEAGLDQINVLIPVSLAGSGDTAISVTIDGVVSNIAHITIM